MSQQKRRLYKDDNSASLNEDGTKKTLRGQLSEIDAIFQKMKQAVIQDEKIKKQNAN